MTNKERHERNKMPKMIKGNDAYYKLMSKKMGKEWADRNIVRICPVNFNKKVKI